MSWKKPNSMGLSITTTLLLAALWVPVVAADSVPPQIHMNTGMEQYEPGVIKTMVMDDTKVSNVTLFYRERGESYYNSTDMKRRNDIYYRELNKELGLDGTIEYYILAQDTAGNQSTEPRMDPEENPMTAAASEEADTSAPEVSLANPEPGAILDTGDEPVMVTFFTTEREVDLNTVRFKIDNRDRTREAELIGNVLYWEPRRPLTNGFHEIEVIVKDTNGDYLGPNIWTFKVKTRAELPLGAEGDFYLGISRDDRSGENHSVPLWDNKIDLGLKGEAGFLNWSAGVMLSSEETGFLTTEDMPDRQPINRFYFDGRTRHFRIRLGDSNPNFSELSMKGILVRGINAEFKSNRFQAQYVQGYNKREIDQRMQIIAKNVVPDATNSTQYYDEDGQLQTLSGSQQIITDPMGKTHVYEFLPGTFRRKVSALQADVVPLKNRFATWKFGLNVFSAEDDSSSLSYDEDNEDRPFMFGGAEFGTEYNPKKNWVGTFETSLRFNDNRSEISAEFGGTLATENMFGAIPEEIKDDLPEDIDDELFRFNASTQTSFDKGKLVDDIGAGATDAITSVYKLKLTTPVPIPMTSTYLKGEMYRVPTHYISLGNPQQKTDIGGFKFDIRTRILRDQLSLNFGYDAYSDNLESERKQYANNAGTLQQDLTKDTNVASFSASVRPRILAEYQPSLTVGYRMYTGVNNLDQNITANELTDMIDSQTNTVMVSLGGTLPVGVQKHTGTLSISNMNITDERPIDVWMLNESKNLTVLFNVNSAVNPLPLVISASFGRTSNLSYRPLYDINTVAYDRKELTTGINILNIAGTYKWFRDKRLSTSAGIGMLGSSNGETDMYKVDNSKTSLKFEANYRLTSVATVGAHVRYISYSDSANPESDYTEPIFGFMLRSAF